MVLDSLTVKKPDSGPWRAALLGAVAIAAGTFLPWLTVTTPSGGLIANGLDWAGPLTLIAAVLLAVIVGTSISRIGASRLGGIAMVAVGAFSLGVAVQFLAAVLFDGGDAIATPGLGAWMVVIGAGLSFGAGVLALTRLGASSGDPSVAWKAIAIGVGVAAVVAIGGDLLLNRVGLPEFTQISMTLG